MMRVLLSVLVFLSAIAGSRAEGKRDEQPPLCAKAMAADADSVVMPSPTNAVRLRLYTNAAPDAPHLVNTFDLEAGGELLLQSPRRDVLASGFGGWAMDSSPHPVLVNGAGPDLASTNSMTVIEQAAGQGWRYLALDMSAAYRGRLETFKRAILFVEPDLFILHDHLEAKERFRFQARIHPRAETMLDTNWGDLRLELSGYGLHIHAPSTKGTLRAWKRVASAADSVLPGTVTMELCPANKVSRLDLLTVFAAYPAGVKRDYVFKLLESNTAVGARIHRAGLPTLVAFKTDAAAPGASLTGFAFGGPVGVSVFAPKEKLR